MSETKSPKEIEHHIDRIKLEVAKYLLDHAMTTLPQEIICNGESMAHIINIGTSILCTKWKIGYPGGSFVEAVVNNDLMGAFGRADHINKKSIEFYCSLIYNMNYIE